MDSHGQEVDALSSRLAQAEDDVQKLREEEHNAVALVAASDQKHQIELDALGKQLEGRYEQHLGALRKQYESQCSRLQEQLSGLHAQFQERGTPRRNSSMLSNGDPSYGDGPLTGRSDQGSTGYGEREELEKRIRQAEARSIALTQQLQSMPSSLQVTGSN